MLDEDSEEFFITDASEAFIVESWMEPTELKIKSLWEWPEPDETPLKIAVCGAGGTGKKALTVALAEKLDIPAIEGIVRNCHRLGYKLNKASSMDDELAIFFAYLWSVLEYDEFVSAGSVIDVLAYMHYIIDKTGTKHMKLLQRAVANCSHIISTSMYSVFIYLPFERKPQADGVRSVDVKFHQQIDQNIKYYLNAFDIDYLPIGGGQRQKFTTAYQYLEEFGLLVDRDI